MTKVTRREACSLLLRGAGLLSGLSITGCTYLGPTAPAIPKDCVWVQSPGVVACFHKEQIYDESGVVVGEVGPREMSWLELNYEFYDMNQELEDFVKSSGFPP